jgi:hypothetical protein
MIDDGDFGAIGGIKFGRETEVLGENLPHRHFVAAQNPRDQTRLRTEADAVGNTRLMA